MRLDHFGQSMDARKISMEVEANEERRTAMIIELRESKELQSDERAEKEISYKRKMKILNSKDQKEKIEYIFGTSDMIGTMKLLKKLRKIRADSTGLLSLIVGAVPLSIFTALTTSFFSDQVVTRPIYVFITIPLAIVLLFISGRLMYRAVKLAKENVELTSDDLKRMLSRELTEDTKKDYPFLKAIEEYGKDAAAIYSKRFIQYRTVLNEGKPIYLNDNTLDFNEDRFDKLLLAEIQAMQVEELE